MKKIILIVGVVILAGITIFFLFNRVKPTATGTPNTGSPFGTGEGVGIPALGTDSVGETTEFDGGSSASLAQIFRISNTPTAGFVILARGNDSWVRFVDRATGHIFETKLPLTEADANLEKVRITNTTLPKIYEAHFSTNGLSVLLRSLVEDSDVIDNLTLTLTPPRASSTDTLYGVAATNLRGDIDNVASGANLFFSLRNNGGIVSSTFTGGNTKTLFTSPFTNWRVSLLGNNLLVFPKPSFRAMSSLYSLSSGGGSLTKITGPFAGLMGVSNPAGNRILYSYYEEDSTKTFTLNTQAKSLSEILPATLAEKCVWSTREVSKFYCGVPITTISGNLPDDWYLGKTHFTDYIWQFDTDAETAKLISQPKTDFGLDLDISEPKVNTSEDFMVFINKRDQTLWGVRLK